MSEVTVICCWTNEKQYQDFVKTLNAQTIPYELIGIDNRGNRAFTSCAAAYNSVIDRVRTKYVIYSHQDILLQDSECLLKFMSYLERTGRDDILGVAGVKFDTAGVFSDIMHIQSSTGKLVKVGTHIPDGMMECNTLDECFFGGHSEHFEAFPFNEDICNGWHLYAVEACLKTQSIRSLQDGGVGQVYACDIPLIHNSTDGVDYAFYWQLFKLCRYYAKHFPKIRTTCSGASTDMLHALNRLIRGSIEVFMRSIE